LGSSVVPTHPSRTFPGGRIQQEIVFVRDAGMAKGEPITDGLQSIVSMFGGYVEGAGKDGVKVTPLLQSRGPATTNETNGIVQKRELFQQSFFGQAQLNPYARRERRNDDLTLAARVEGAPADGQEKGLNLIYVADLDMIGNQFFQLRSQVLDPNVRFDNVTFALNCIDTLVGDDSLIELRKRRPILRKLTAVEEAQRVYEDEWQREKEAAEAAAAESLDKAQKRLDDAVAKIREDQTLDAQAKEVKIVEVQQNENRKFELEKAQIEDRKNRRLEEAQHDRDAARTGIHDRYRLVTLLLAAVPGILLGLFTYRRRSSRASSIIPSNRLVGGSN